MHYVLLCLGYPTSGGESKFGLIILHYDKDDVKDMTISARSVLIKTLQKMLQSRTLNRKSF